ncbi:MAG: flagellar filament outer layer protein FlaA [Spirochaetia bacterium]|jgi:hypothetical protein|nr:flagellar filament outer layer protein FlaA [Spirochaetia bacterium]
MKKILCVVTIIFLAGGFAFAQQDQQDQQDQRETKDTAQQEFKTISVTKFEDAGYWKATISGDEGLAVGRKLEGKPADKKAIPDEEAIGITDVEIDDYVLGVKTMFFRRGAATISVEPTRPIQLPGIVRSLSVWVVGRNYNHVLKAVFRDFDGHRFELTSIPGKLNFSGWKELVVPIPEEIKQRDAHYSILTGIEFLGFKIECDMAETYGSYFLYFDEMRIRTDLFSERDRDQDDMLDAW